MLVTSSVIETAWKSMWTMAPERGSRWMSFISAVSVVPSNNDFDQASAAAVREQVLERAERCLDRARGAVAVDVGWHDSLAAQPPDVLPEHAAWLGAQLKGLGHMRPSIGSASG